MTRRLLLALAFLLAAPLHGLAQDIDCANPPTPWRSGKEAADCWARQYDRQREENDRQREEMARKSAYLAAAPIRACQAAVLAVLKAPGTARFVSGVVSTRGPYAVVGEVDAQNSYGGLMRNTYGCQMRGTTVIDVQVVSPK